MNELHKKEILKLLIDEAMSRTGEERDVLLEHIFKTLGKPSDGDGESVTPTAYADNFPDAEYETDVVVCADGRTRELRLPKVMSRRRRG